MFQAYNTMKDRQYCVYILANTRNTVLHIGMTNNIERRLREHQTGEKEGFVQRYGLKKLVYLEMFSEVRDALYREKQLKYWRRVWKLDLIRQENPGMIDLRAKATSS